MSSRIVFYSGNFFFSLFVALITFIFLPFLSSFIPVAYTGFVLAGGAMFALLFFPFVPQLTAHYGPQRLVLIFATLEGIALVALAANPGPFASMCFVALTIALQPFIAYELDLLLEEASTNIGTTGRVRAVFLTAWNLAGLVAALLVGTLLTSSDAYGHVFLAAAIALVPFVILLALPSVSRKISRDPINVRATIACLLHDRDLAAVTFGHLLLYLFFVWAPYYTPIYLHVELGIPWSDLGWMFSLMLLPYLLIQYPAGMLADRVFGDKELMLVGFILAGTSFAMIGFFTTATPLFIIACTLFISRVGTALVEGMTEAHFFRRISEKDVNTISIFRGIWPLTELVAPIVGSLILVFSNFELFFILTGGCIAITGSLTTLYIKDFR